MEARQSKEENKSKGKQKKKKQERCNHVTTTCRETEITCTCSFCTYPETGSDRAQNLYCGLSSQDYYEEINNIVLNK